MSHAYYIVCRNGSLPFCSKPAYVSNVDLCLCFFALPGQLFFCILRRIVQSCLDFFTSLFIMAGENHIFRHAAQTFFLHVPFSRSSTFRFLFTVARRSSGRSSWCRSLLGRRQQFRGGTFELPPGSDFPELWRSRAVGFFFDIGCWNATFLNRKVFR